MFRTARKARFICFTPQHAHNIDYGIEEMLPALAGIEFIIDLAVADEHDPMAVAGGENIMSHHQYRSAVFLVDHAQQIQQGFTRVGVKIAGRFISAKMILGLVISARQAAARCC